MSEEKTTEETPKASLLFVDDERNILSSLKRLFRSEGYTIHLASSGAEALELLKKEKIDLIISDMRMPEMNGAEFLERVGKKWPRITRILLTGYAEISATIDAINKGHIYKYISKPWEDNDIKLTVKHALEAQQIEKERDRLLILTRQQNEELKEFNTNLEGLVKARTAELDQTMGMLETAYATLKDSYSSTIKVFSNFIEMREGSLRGQSRKIAEQASKLILNLEKDEDNAQQVSYAGMLRDIGKIGFPDRLFNKPVDAMTKDDWNEYAKHPVVGAGILMALEPLQMAAKIIRSYREQYDGKGYPDGLKGNEIPLGSRVLSVVSDFYTLQSGSLVSERLSAKDARDYLLKNKGSIYDPEVVTAFINYLGNIREEQRSSEIQEKRVDTKHLVKHMLLTRDITTKSGILLLSSGHKLGDHIIEQLNNLEQTLNETFEIYVKV